MEYLWKCFLLHLGSVLQQNKDNEKNQEYPLFLSGEAQEATGVTNSPNPPCSSGSSPSASPPRNSPTCPCSPRAALEREGHTTHGFGCSEPSELLRDSRGLRTHSFSHLAGNNSKWGSSCAWFFPFLLGTGGALPSHPPIPAQWDNWEPKGEQDSRVEGREV